MRADPIGTHGPGHAAEVVPRSPPARTDESAAPLFLPNRANVTSSPVEEAPGIEKNLSTRAVPCDVVNFDDGTHGLSRHAAECVDRLVRFLADRTGHAPLDR